MRRRLTACLVGLLLTSCSSSTPAPSSAAPAAKVSAAVPESALATVVLSEEAQRRLDIQTAPVERRTVASHRTLGGDVVPEGGAVTTVTAPFAGTIATDAPPPRVGAEVGAGGTVLALTPFAPADRDVRIEAERAVAEAAGRHEMTQKRVARATQLVADGSGSRRAVEEAEAELVVAGAALQAARDRLTLAASGVTASGAVVLSAPHASILRALYAVPGQVVAAGTPLFDLVRLDTVWLRVPVYAGDLAALDGRAAVDVWPLGATVRDTPVASANPVTAPPVADPVTAGVDLFYRISNAGRSLRPGQRVSVRVPLRAHGEHLVVPVAAILMDAMGGTWVYEARPGGQFVRQRVAVLEHADEFALLQQGPPIGTRVVTVGAAELFGTEFGVGK